MAEAKLEVPFAEIHGAIERKGIINRQKKFRDNNGSIIFEGKQEVYVMKNPRDFKKNPPKGAELANQACWLEACQRASQILFITRLNQLPDDLSPQDLAEQQEALLAKERFHRQLNHIPDYYTPEEAQTLYTEFHQRYLAQLPNKRETRPDQDAPIDKVTHKRKRYLQFPAFLRAMLYLSLKQKEN